MQRTHIEHTRNHLIGRYTYTARSGGSSGGPASGARHNQVLSEINAWRAPKPPTRKPRR